MATEKTPIFTKRATYVVDDKLMRMLAPTASIEMACCPMSPSLAMVFQRFNSAGMKLPMIVPAPYHRDLDKHLVFMNAETL